MQPTRRLLKIGGLVSACLIVAEMAFRLVGPSLPPPTPSLASTKRSQMEELGKSGGVEIVLAGHSMMHHAGDASALSEQLGARTYNAALSALNPDVQASWLLDEVIPRLEPSLILLGVSSIDFNENVRNPNIDRVASECCPSLRPWTAKLEQWFSNVSQLVHYRSSVNSPVAAARALRWIREGDLPQENPVDSFGFPIKADEPAFSVTRIHEDHVRSTILNHFHVSDNSIDAIRDLVEKIENQNIDVVLAEMPVTDEYIGLHPEEQVDYSVFQAALRSAGRDLGVPVWISSSEFAEHRYFFDSHHMNARGSRAFITAISHWMRSNVQDLDTKMHPITLKEAMPLR